MRLKKIELEITNACNLKCIHCFAESGKKKEDELTTNEIIDFIDYLSEKKVDELILSGGEIFVREDFYKIAEKASEKGILTTLFTNGSLITEKDIPKLKSLEKLKTIQVSLDGFFPETHDSIRGVPGSFEKTVNAVNLLLEKGLPVKLVVSVMKQNIHEIENIARWCSFSGVEYGLSVLNSTGRAGKKIYPSKEEFIKLKEYPGLYDERFISNSKTACGIGFEKIAVQPNGNISPCMPLQDIVLGNIRTDDLVGVFNNHPVMKEIRESTVGKIKECKNCPAKERCMGGCKQRAFAMHGRFNAPDDVQCVVFKKNHKPKLEYPENFPLK